jgi:hypothetical protein
LSWTKSSIAWCRGARPVRPAEQPNINKRNGPIN